MVSKITIFEPHFDGAQFGPASIGSEGMLSDLESSDDFESSESSELPEIAEDRDASRGRSLVRSAAIGVVIVGILVGVAALRRVRSSEPVEIEEQPEQPVDELAVE